MSEKIYTAPEEIKAPEFDFENFNAKTHQEKEDKYVEEIKQYLQNLGYNGKNFGEIINFPVADSHASYLIISMKPLMLLHLELGDAWTFQYVHLLTAKEVQQKVDQNKAIERIFSQKGK